MRWFLVRVQDLEPFSFVKSSTYSYMTSSTPTAILIKALEILVNDVQSNDGVANATIAEAADRLKKLDNRVIELEDTIRNVIKELDEITN